MGSHNEIWSLDTSALTCNNQKMPAYIMTGYPHYSLCPLVLSLMPYLEYHFTRALVLVKWCVTPVKTGTTIPLIHVNWATLALVVWRQVSLLHGIAQRSCSDYQFQENKIQWPSQGRSLWEAPMLLLLSSLWQPLCLPRQHTKTASIHPLYSTWASQDNMIVSMGC